MTSTFKDDADFDSYIEEKKASVSEMVQKNANLGLEVQTPPFGGGKKTDGKPASEVECDAIAGMIM